LFCLSTELLITLAEIKRYTESVISAFDVTEYGVILMYGKSLINDFSIAFSFANCRFTVAKLKYLPTALYEL
jgi:hypothetical protein